MNPQNKITNFLFLSQTTPSPRGGVGRGLIFLFFLFAIAGQAKTYKTIKSPESMACVNVYQGELKADEVIMTDTATTVRFTMEYSTGQYFCFVSSSYLIDEDGRRYPLRSAEGIALDEWVQSPENGVTHFTMHFAPLPKNTQIFDFIEGDVPGAFMLLGIHDKKYKIKAPTFQELSDANPYTVPADWFKTDTITVRGRIEGYNAERFGFTSMECYYDDVFEKDASTFVLDIAPDGTFEKKFQASYPVRQSFHSQNSKVGLSEIPFFARPGETIDITVRPDGKGGYVYLYTGSSREVQRWLRADDQSLMLARPLAVFKGSFAEANQLAETVWRNMLYRLQVVSRREHYTPMEMQLALANAQVRFGYAYMDYAEYREGELRKKVYRDGKFYIEITDSAEWNALRDHKYYTCLRHIDFDNPLLFASESFPVLLNRIQYAKPVGARKYDGTADENGEIEDTLNNELKKLDNGRAARRDVMAVDHDNLMAQMCTYQDMVYNFNSWRSFEDAIPELMADTTITDTEKQEILEETVRLSKMYPVCLATFTNPYIHQKAEQFYAFKMAQKELATPLPDEPIAAVIRSLCAKYPGRYLMLDFWGMGCGPCRATIQSTKEVRAEIAKRNDVKLVFIAGERTTEGSDAYKKYVAEWLADEETVCLTNDDFRRLQEMLRFNGIPHYETVTPDGRLVRDDLRFNGFDHFTLVLQQLKSKLE